MSVNRLERKQLIRSDLSTVWNYFSSPQNLNELTPASLHFEIISELPNTIYEGLLIEYRIKPFPFTTFKWVTRIRQVEPLASFTDEQLEGPYKIWVHRHIFEQTNEGVLMTDIVHYQSPLKVLGRIADASFVKSKVNGIFNYRYNKINQIFTA